MPRSKVSKVPQVSGVSKVKTKKSVAKSQAALSVDVFDKTGKVIEKMTLQKEIFGQDVNNVLMAQAVRVYLANQRAGSASTKSRGEVRGSTRKIYRQKGTGRARHGAITAPIFVHGGVAFGPKPHDFSLKLTKKMKRKALFSALSQKLKEKSIHIVDGLSTIEPKTKAMAEVITRVLPEKKKRVLFVTASDAVAAKRAARNLKGVTLEDAKNLTTYRVLSHPTLVFMKETVPLLTKHFLSEGK